MQWWVWIVAAVAMLVAELLTPGGFYFLFFGVGALATALLTLAGVDNPLTQAIVFFGVSLCAVASLRKPLLQRLQPRRGGPAVDSLIGESATLRATLHPGDFGQAELRGTTWTVRNVGGVALNSGQRCIVEQVDGLTLLIRAAE